MPFVELGDVRLFYTDEGSGDRPLLLVHGYTADSHGWSWQLPHLVADHRVIAVDLRGHGWSSAPAGGYTTAQFAADLAGLLDHLEIERVVGVGHSMGGSVVSALAVEYPDRVAAVVAVDPAYLLPDETAGAIGPMLDLLVDRPGAVRPSEPYLRRRRCPVLTFYADPARAAIERAVFTDPRSRVVTWEGAGHWLHQERPAEFNTLVTGWLASIA
ncbi:alpha/beta hydrolase [Parafrankia sp. FMc6]|uniref:alpha/beta fold hydrolase n=1 Tax=Parafrankia soli TaxID=2599596 RepID=UPI0034D79414